MSINMVVIWYSLEVYIGFQYISDVPFSEGTSPSYTFKDCVPFM